MSETARRKYKKRLEKLVKDGLIAHYGTLPIVHATGGLKDTVIDIDEDKERGQGFVFSRMLPEEIEKAVDRAIGFYSSASADEFAKARQRGMTEDFTWVKSASSYNDLYNSVAR